jgi:hypothetical protein
VLAFPRLPWEAALRFGGWAVLPVVRLSSMGVLRQAIEDQRERTDAAALGRLALSRREAAEARGVSVDFLEEPECPGTDERSMSCGSRPVKTAWRRRSLSQGGRTNGPSASVARQYDSKYHVLFQFQDGKIERVREHMETAPRRCALRGGPSVAATDQGSSQPRRQPFRRRSRHRMAASRPIDGRH